MTPSSGPPISTRRPTRRKFFRHAVEMERDGVSHRTQTRVEAEEAQRWELSLTSGIGMISFPVDEGQEATGIEVQVVVVRI